MTERTLSQRPAKTAIVALFIQVAAWAFVAGLLVVFKYLHIRTGFTWLHLAVVQGLIAAFLSRRLTQPAWWQWIHLGFSPLIILLLASGVSSWWYFAIFLILLLVYWTTFRTRVPFFLTNQQTLEALEPFLIQQKPKTVADLGCASGGVLADFAQKMPETRFMGYEIAPLPVLFAKWRTRNCANVSIKFSDFWRADFSRFDVVYAFLSDEPMAQLWQKARQEMRPNTLFISNTFHVPNETPTEIIHVDDFRGTELLIWRMTGSPENNQLHIMISSAVTKISTD